jgi:hypothetical protein
VKERRKFVQSSLQKQFPGHKATILIVHLPRAAMLVATVAIVPLQKATGLLLKVNPLLPSVASL